MSASPDSLSSARMAWLVLAAGALIVIYALWSRGVAATTIAPDPLVGLWQCARAEKDSLHVEQKLAFLPNQRYARRASRVLEYGRTIFEEEYETGWYAHDGEALLLAPDTWTRSLPAQPPTSQIENASLQLTIVSLDATTLTLDDDVRAPTCKYVRVQRTAAPVPSAAPSADSAF